MGLRVIWNWRVDWNARRGARRPLRGATPSGAESGTGVGGGEKCGDEFFARDHLRKRDRGFACRDGTLFDAQGGGGVSGRHIRSAIGPAAAERHIHAEAEFASLIAGEAHDVEKLVGHVGEVLEGNGRVVEGERVDRLDFEAADASSFHHAHLFFEFGLGDTGAEPPPAHHDAGVIGGILKRLSQVGGGSGEQQGVTEENQDA